MIDQYTGLIYETSSLLGISAQAIGTLMVLIFVVMFGILSYFYFGSIIVSFVVATCILTVAAFLGIVPGWLVFAHLIITGFTILIAVPNSSTESQVVAEASDQWTEYGNKLKAAYAAKFGGSNPGFDDEVEQRIRIMRATKRGFAHTIARDWLKRIERFTEAA